MALVPGLREGVAVVPFVFLAVLAEFLPRRVAGVDERDGVFDRVGLLAVADLVDAVGGVVVLQPVDEARRDAWVHVAQRVDRRREGVGRPEHDDLRIVLALSARAHIMLPAGCKALGSAPRGTGDPAT